MPETITNSQMAAFIISALTTTIIPLLLIIIFSIRKKLSITPLFVGAFAFFVSQMVLRIPILSILEPFSWFQSFMNNVILSAILIGGLSAGIFEESARYLGARFILKNKRTYKDAISFGLGHGLCEVILLNGVANMNNTIYSILLNSGNLQSMLAEYPEGTYEQIVSSLTNTSPLIMYISVLERIPAVIFHIFAAILIYKAVNEKRIILYIASIIAHTFVNSSVVLLSNYTNVYIGEAAFLIIGAACLFYIIRSKKNWPVIENVQPEPQYGFIQK